MKKILLFIFCVMAVSVNAQVFIENFATAPTGSNLESYNSWYVCLKSSEALGVSPKIEEGTLFYTGYVGSDQGKVVLLDSLVGKDASTQRISSKIITFGTDTLTPVVGKKMYAAFLVQILPNSYTSYRDFFTWEGSATSNSSRGRVFVRSIAGTNDIQFAVSKNTASTSAYVESDVITGGVGLNFLMVLVYETIDGDSNDQISLYINPDLSKAEAEQVKLDSKDIIADYSGSTQMRINLRQRGIGAYVGGIRVARTWNEAVKGGGTNAQVIKNTEYSIRSYNNTIITNGAGTVHVYDITGRQVMNKITSGRLQTSLQKGIYIVRFQDNVGKVVSGKISINK